MREIKFRAWDTLKDRYLDWDEIISGFNMACVFDGSGFDEEKPRFIPEQFTSLLDKNGKEIYEGDIVKSHSGEIRVVAFLSGCFLMIIPGDDVDANADMFHPFKEEEVIGNIHENPELLERES